MSELDEVIEEFLVESYENLDRFDADLLALEEHPDDQDLLASIFRTIHTIKGTCGFLGFTTLERVAHVGENLLSLLRDGRLQLTKERATALLSLGDAVRSMLKIVEETSAEGDNDYATLVATLQRLTEGDDAAATTGSATSTAGSATATDPAAAPEATAHAAASAPGGAPESAPAPDATTQPAPTAAPEATTATDVPDVPAAATAAATSTGAEAVPTTTTTPQPGAATEHIAPTEHVPAADGSAPQITDDGDHSGDGGGDGRRSVSESTIRVDVGLLDSLMNLVGELVLARNQIMQHTSGVDANLSAASQHLNLITTELQERVMKTRLQQIGTIWSKFPRVVRDLALALGKEVNIEMEGRETELDKTIIEAIKDPLTHLVRNSVDHGIESPEQRVAAGKPRTGRLSLRAYHEGGQVNIEIVDDGAGIDPERIRAKAVAKGLLSPDQAQRMGDREAVSMIFAPGFSTAEKVTNVSGRGVGMDVVRTNIERIGGQVDISSEVGRGTTLKVKIPLTLAIIPALTVWSGDNRYAIPQVSLLELVRLAGEDARAGIEHLDDTPVYRLRGQLLPLVRLSNVLGETSGEPEPESEPGEPGAAVNIVVLQADDSQFGLIVDNISDTEEIVVKPLGKQVKNITCFAGATIMGDGRVALILDVLGCAQEAGVIATHGDRQRAEREQAAADAAAADDRQSLLIVGVGTDTQAAVPLSQVARLDEFPMTAIEQAGGARMVQYRDEIVPLVDLAEVVSGGMPLMGDDKSSVSVVVSKYGSRSIGLIVDRILDIVETSLDLDSVARRHGVLGTTVVQGKVTEVVDLPTLSSDLAARLFAEPATSEFDLDPSFVTIGAGA